MSGTTRRRLRLELRLALGSAIGSLAFLTLLAATGAALWVGMADVATQRAEIERAQVRAAEQRADAYPPGFADQDAGSVAYGMFHVVADPPGPWSFIALGTRAGSNILQRVRLLGLEAQIHDGELVHPELAAAGSFDFAFVVIFLLPLTLIATLHDLRSGEAEAGRLPLLATTLASPGPFWRWRAGLRTGLALVATLGPLVIASLIAGAPLAQLPRVVFAVTAYALFWTLLACLVALRRGMSSIAATVVLLSLWSVLVLVLPAAIGALAATVHPTQRGPEIVLAQRLKVNDAWDLPKEATFEEFFAHYPEWRDTAPVTTRFHWKWYFAFHEVGDRSVADAVAAHNAAQQRQERLIAAASLLAPPLALQRVLTATAETDAARRWNHLAAVRRFHTALRLHFYPLLFDEKPFTEDSLQSLPRFEPAPRAIRPEVLAFSGLALFTTLVGAGLLRGRGTWSVE